MAGLRQSRVNYMGSSHGTRLQRFLQEMNREALDGYDCMTAVWVAKLVARETTIRQGL